jgi:mRNA interferase MazF
MATTRPSREASQTSFPKRGEIFLTALDPTVGREIQKTRPVVIIQNDVSNRLTDMTIVAPITSTVRFPLSPVHVLLAADQRTGLSVTSVALLNQIRAIDRTRLIKKLGAIDVDTAERVDEAIKLSLGLIAL